MKSSCFKIMSLVVVAAWTAAGAERAVVSGGKAVGLIGANGAEIAAGDGRGGDRESARHGHEPDSRQVCDGGGGVDDSGRLVGLDGQGRRRDDASWIRVAAAGKHARRRMRSGDDGHLPVIGRN